MDELDNTSIGDLDVRLQLKKLLTSERFQTKEVRALLLQYVVEQTLAGEVLTQEKIGKALFPGFEPGVHDDVRVNASYLRDDLSEYYAKEGKDDLVRVEIKERYKAIFSYNPNAEIVTLYRLGLYHMSLLTEDDLETAVRHFVWVVKLKKDFAPAYSAQAEALLCYEALYTLIRKSGGRGPLLDTSLVLTLVNHSLEYDPKNWKAHVILGAFYCTQCNWAKASNSFDKAMSMNHIGVTANFWYAAFLLAIGEQQEALRIVETIARHFPDNVNAQLMSGLFLYVARRYERATPHIVSAHNMNRHHWAPHLLDALIDLAIGRSDQAMYSLSLLDDIIWYNDSHELLWAGFKLFTARHAYDSYETRRNRLTCSEAQFPSTMDKVMFRIAEGMNDGAVKELESLRGQPCPITCWLHLWPVFDPLKETPRFKRLVAAMNLPKKRTNKRSKNH